MATTAPPTTVPPTTAAPLDGEVCWGHDTNVTEESIRDFLNNWIGATIVGSGDQERMLLWPGDEAISETWHIGAGRISFDYNHYLMGSGAIAFLYKDGSTKANCEADSWHEYMGPYISQGWVKLKIRELDLGRLILSVIDYNNGLLLLDDGVSGLLL